MNIVAFAGPSLAPAARACFTDVDWRPPAEAGDLLRLRGGPDLTVCLIDGYFDHRPAVRHKEILLLLSEGTRVLGASSIGALRAAEMDGLGMTGVGAIYAAYARGSLTADDEVALVHADGDRGWRPLSLPLVDARATLCRALREKVITKAQARDLLSAGAAIHYVDRTWPEVLRTVSPPGFASWLRQGQVEQKAIDAAACIRAACTAAPVAPRRPQMVKTVFVGRLARERAVDLGARC